VGLDWEEDQQEARVHLPRGVGVGGGESVAFGQLKRFGWEGRGEKEIESYGCHTEPE